MRITIQIFYNTYFNFLKIDMYSIKAINNIEHGILYQLQDIVS